MKKVTIQDIALEMGLSRNTVAKALNGGDVSPQTKQAVVQTAWKMGYAKIDDQLLEEMENRNRKVNSGTVLVLFREWNSVFWNRILTGISAAVTEEGYRMQLHIVDESDLDGDEILKQIADDVKGIIFLCIFPIRFVKGISRAGLPMTFFNTPVNGQEYIQLGDVINVDGFYAMDRLTEYLIEEKGCRNMSFIGYAEGSRGVQARYLGYLSACRRYGVNVDESIQFTKPSNLSFFTYSMVEETLSTLTHIPEAFVCENDDVAKSVALYLVQTHPELIKKIIITGFDHTIEDDFFKKDILTVEVRIEELGKRLVKSVTERVKNPNQDLAFITIAAKPMI